MIPCAGERLSRANITGNDDANVTAKSAAEEAVTLCSFLSEFRFRS